MNNPKWQMDQVTGRGSLPEISGLEWSSLVGRGQGEVLKRQVVQVTERRS